MRSEEVRRITAICLVIIIAGVLVITVTEFLLPFGSFPQREIGENIENSVGQEILENAPRETGAANNVTSVIWDYRGYDTLGEATVLFTAVCGIATLFRTSKRRES
ncbi:hypothetical protein AKJ42_02490 [candidate division MSBL1 archaeon SCGC-AAA261C02]|uniref:MrpA C-terminal/MbhE domain-containing protein n=1 Tax=candidate division MSBL1 archaeon SCGC-AAA261C02 TaxID=1698272 RepID=A0A133V031_9EURY|nr:hypothetical protein AKJ42_02490 [candidate division MSBL1 archaeon SCGC-AAA261C02]